MEKLVMIPLIVLLVAALLIAAGHWFPWQLAIGRRLSRLEAYTYGVAAILAPALVALLSVQATTAAAIVAAAALGAGAMTLCAYAIDRLIAMRHELMDAKDANAYGRANELPTDTGD
jgi:hypothetical protein